MATGRENRFIPLALRFGKSNRDLFWRKTEKFKLQREPKLDYWKLPLGLQVLERRRRFEACAGGSGFRFLHMTLSVGGSGVGRCFAQTASSVRCSSAVFASSDEGAPAGFVGSLTVTGHSTGDWRWTTDDEDEELRNWVLDGLAILRPCWALRPCYASLGPC